MGRQDWRPDLVSKHSVALAAFFVLFFCLHVFYDGLGGAAERLARGDAGTPTLLNLSPSNWRLIVMG